MVAIVGVGIIFQEGVKIHILICQFRKEPEKVIALLDKSAEIMAKAKLVKGRVFYSLFEVKDLHCLITETPVLRVQHGSLEKIAYRNIFWQEGICLYGV